MSWFPRPSSPRAAFRDLALFMNHRSREQRIAAALAVLITTIIVILFVVDAKFGVAPVEEEYSFDLVRTANRTDAQIAADQKKDQATAQAEKKKEQQQYQRLAKQLGIE